MLMERSVSHTVFYSERERQRETERDRETERQREAAADCNMHERSLFSGHKQL